MTYTVRIHPDSDGLWAEVDELPGCFATGDSLVELWENLEASMSTYLSRDIETEDDTVFFLTEDQIECAIRDTLKSLGLNGGRKSEHRNQGNQRLSAEGGRRAG